MALVVEDGTGLANAESYESVSGADAYWAARGNTVWSGMSVAAREQSLRRATQFLDMTYLWTGRRSHWTQALGWPRTGAYDELGYALAAVPAVLKAATAEAALLASEGPLVGYGAPAPRDVASVQAGSVRVEFTAPATSQVTSRFLFIGRLVAPLLRSDSGGLTAVRG